MREYFRKFAIAMSIILLLMSCFFLSIFVSGTQAISSYLNYEMLLLFVLFISGTIIGVVAVIHALFRQRTVRKPRKKKRE